MKFILTELELWENFKKEKTKIPECVNLFTKIVKSRHKVAHHEVALKWFEELLDKDFKNHQRAHTMIQTDLLDILEIKNEFMEIKPFTEYIGAVKSIGDIVTGYIGFYDNFIYKRIDLRDK